MNKNRSFPKVSFYLKMQRRGENCTLKFQKKHISKLQWHEKNCFKWGRIKNNIHLFRNIKIRKRICGDFLRLSRACYWNYVGIYLLAVFWKIFRSFRWIFQWLKANLWATSSPSVTPKKTFQFKIPIKNFFSSNIICTFFLYY